MTLDVAGDEACSFQLAYIVENPGAQQQQYATTLEKKDASPGSCHDAKGFVVLAQHSYADPAGVVRRHATDAIIAVAWASLRPTSMNLSVGYDVILDGTGDFPGATGDGPTFEATWSNFLAPTPQQPSPADAATRQ